MEQSQYRLEILQKIKEYEKQGLWNDDVENDPPTIELLPDKVDYLNKKLSSKIMTALVNIKGQQFINSLIKNNQLIIENIEGIENFKAVKGGAIITSNHFHPFENFAVWEAIRPHMKGKLYRVIREGNYTNPPSGFKTFFRHCNTLPLSSNSQTMRKFLKAIHVLLNKGKKILVYPEQSMWWNYRKPRPFKNGAFNFAVKNNVPIIPIFITMKDSELMDNEGFPIQKLTLHILPAIYPSPELTSHDNVENMKKQNYEAWVKVYEDTYGTPLKYEW